MQVLVTYAILLESSLISNFNEKDYYSKRDMTKTNLTKNRLKDFDVEE